MHTRKLNPLEFHETRINPQRVEAGEPVVDFWEYVAAIPPEDFAFADCRAGDVTHVYRMEDKYEHVLINSQYQGVAMVIVVDLQSQSIYGHMLLDLNPVGTKEPEA